MCYGKKNKIGKKDLKCQWKDGEISERMGKKTLTGKIRFGEKAWRNEWTMHYVRDKHFRQREEQV